MRTCPPTFTRTPAALAATLLLALAGATATVATTARAADFSDTYIGYRYGTKFAEPFGRNDIHKDIINLNHVSSYKYGVNFFNLDVLLSDKNDPSALGSSNGAQELYLTYRHTLDMSKVLDRSLQMGPVRSLGFTGGFDINSKTDVGYNSKKRLLGLGPTIMFDVPGYLNLSLLGQWESNQPSGLHFTATGPVPYQISRYSYKPYLMLSATWAMPLGKGSPWSFEGYANYATAKGKNESGVDTAPSTNIDMQLMYDLGSVMGSPGRFKVGVEYQYWKNKFGNNAAGVAGPGAFAKTPMLRAEYHF